MSLSPQPDDDQCQPELPAATVAARFTALAASVEESRPDATLMARMRTTQTWCERAAAAERSATRRQLFTNVQQSLATWQQVWPRLGAQREFRLAVAREARQWAKRLSA